MLFQVPVPSFILVFSFQLQFIIAKMDNIPLTSVSVSTVMIHLFPAILSHIFFICTLLPSLSTFYYNWILKFVIIYDLYNAFDLKFYADNASNICRNYASKQADQEMRDPNISHPLKYPIRIPEGNSPWCMYGIDIFHWKDFLLHLITVCGCSECLECYLWSQTNNVIFTPISN